MLECDQCYDKVPDPQQSGEGLYDEYSRCRHIDCCGRYQLVTVV